MKKKTFNRNTQFEALQHKFKLDRNRSQLKTHLVIQRSVVKVLCYLCVNLNNAERTTESVSIRDIFKSA